MRRAGPALSLRQQLLVGILVPVFAFVVFNTLSLYHETLQSLHTAYDRTLLASAKSISEQLDVEGYDGDATLHATVPYSALEAFEADNQSRMFYRVSNLHGELVSGFAELPVWRGTIPARARPMPRWSISTTTNSAASRCAWPCCCSPCRRRAAGAWR